MINRSHNILEVMIWLGRRMNDTELDLMFKELEIKNFEDLYHMWNINYKGTRENILKEVTKRMTPADCSFKLKEVESFKKAKPKFVPRTFIDFTAIDN